MAHSPEGSGASGGHGSRVAVGTRFDRPDRLGGPLDTGLSIVQPRADGAQQNGKPDRARCAGVTMTLLIR